MTPPRKQVYDPFRTVPAGKPAKELVAQKDDAGQNIYNQPEILSELVWTPLTTLTGATVTRGMQVPSLCINPTMLRRRFYFVYVFSAATQLWEVMFHFSFNGARVLSIPYITLFGSTSYTGRNPTITSPTAAYANALPTYTQAMQLRNATNNGLGTAFECLVKADNVAMEVLETVGTSGNFSWHIACYSERA